MPAIYQLIATFGKMKPRQWLQTLTAVLIKLKIENIKTTAFASPLQFSTKNNYKNRLDIIAGEFIQ